MLSEANPLLRHPRVKSHWLLKFELLRHLCLSSKAAILIILWTAMVGTAYTWLKDIVAVSILGSRYAHITDIAILDSIPYVALTITMTFYPLSGFIADVCCGRFKTAIISLTLMLLSFMFLGIACILTLIFHDVVLNTRFQIGLHHVIKPQYEESVAIIILLTFALALFIIGLCAWDSGKLHSVRACMISYLKHPVHEHLGLFIHYTMWAFTFSSIFDHF